MKTFKVLFGGWESSGKETLHHESKTEMQFNDDCREVVNRIVSESDDYHLSNEEVFGLMIEALVSNYGYNKHVVDATFDLPGDEGSYIGRDFIPINSIVHKENIEKFSKKALKTIKESKNEEYYNAYKEKIQKALDNL